MPFNPIKMSVIIDLGLGHPCSVGRLRGLERSRTTWKALKLVSLIGYNLFLFPFDQTQ